MEAFTSAGFLHRKGLQYHWRNRDRTIDGSSNNNNNNSNNSDNVYVNNGAGKATAADPAVLLKTTPITPPEQARQMAQGTAPGDGDGKGEGDGEGDGDVSKSNKYANFDSYLGNFASKRRIKASLLFFVLGAGSWLVPCRARRVVPLSILGQRGF